MHYFIDGYNMLFRLLRTGEGLQRQRELIIYELNKKISLVKLDVSLVFDATFQQGERTRTHYDALEILFTSEGETADEFIIDEIKNSSNPRQETVVTSDKKLAWYVRCRLAQTESVEDFIRRLDKSYKNKLRQIKKPVSPPALPSSQKPPLPNPNLSPIPSKQTPGEDCLSYYERIFEANFQELMRIEEQNKKRVSKPQKRQPRQKKKSAFDAPASSPPQAATEMERWLKAFEERLDDF